MNNYDQTCLRIICNCIPFRTDNANVMTGKYKDVYALLKKDNKDIHLQDAPVIYCTMLLSMAENVCLLKSLKI